MATNKKSTEEDYLDSLLNAVLSDGSEEDGKVNSDDLNEEELLGSIENDLFSDGMENIEEELSLGQGFFQESEAVKPVKKRKDRKTRWGKKKKVEEAVVVEKTKETTEEPKLEDVVQREKPELEAPVAAPEGFEDIFDNQSETEDKAQDDMNELMDILGNLEPSNSEDEEIQKLEMEKTSGRKKRKNRFRKDNSDEMQSEEVSELSEIEMIDDEQQDDGDDLGLGDLSGLFMGDQEEEQPDEDENTRLIDEMENGDYDEADILNASEDEDKKGKKKKEKKEKKKKEPKPKKPKKVKPPKPAKKKEPDEIIHISKGFIIFSISFIALIVIALNLGGKYNNYVAKTDAAVSYYLNQDYDAAYHELSGLSMHEDDQFFYDKIETIMYVQRHYTSYKNLYTLGNYDQALHTLLRGIKMYDKYKEQARELDCFDDLTIVLGWINAGLQDKFGITESQAREMNLIDDRYLYADKVRELASVAEKKEGAEQ